MQLCDISSKLSCSEENYSAEDFNLIEPSIEQIFNNLEENIEREIISEINENITDKDKEQDHTVTISEQNSQTSTMQATQATIFRNSTQQKLDNNLEKNHNNKNWEKVAKHEKKLREYALNKRKEALNNLAKAKTIVKANLTENNSLKSKLDKANKYVQELKSLLQNKSFLHEKVKKRLEHKSFEVKVISNEREKLKLRILNLQESLRHERTKTQQAHKQLAQISDSYKEAKETIAEKNKIINNMQSEHKFSLQKAGSLINEYFQYKYIDAPLNQTEEQAKQDPSEFMQQLKFLENLCVGE